MVDPKPPEPKTFYEKISYATMGDLWGVAKFSLGAAIGMMCFFGFFTWLGIFTDKTLHLGFPPHTFDLIPKWVLYGTFLCVVVASFGGLTIPKFTFKEWIGLWLLSLCYGVVGDLQGYWFDFAYSILFAGTFAIIRLAEKGYERWQEAYGHKMTVAEVFGQR